MAFISGGLLLLERFLFLIALLFLGGFYCWKGFFISYTAFISGGGSFYFLTALIFGFLLFLGVGSSHLWRSFYFWCDFILRKAFIPGELWISNF